MDSEIFKDERQDSQDKRAENRWRSTAILDSRGVEFTTHNDGAHLIIKGSTCRIDFWPGTGKFITRAGITGRGVFNLLKLLKVK